MVRILSLYNGAKDNRKVIYYGIPLLMLPYANDTKNVHLSIQSMAGMS